MGTFLNLSKKFGIMTETDIDFLSVLIGSLLGIAATVIASYIFMKIKETKMKRDLACFLRGEVNFNLNSIEKILREEMGWKFKINVFENFFEHLPLLNYKLGLKVIFFYYTLERKESELEEFFRKTKEEQKRIWESPKKEEIVKEWVDLQELGREVSDGLRERCSHRRYSTFFKILLP